MEIAILAGCVTKLTVPTINSLVNSGYVVFIVSDRFTDIGVIFNHVVEENVFILEENSYFADTWARAYQLVLSYCIQNDIEPKVDLLVHISDVVDMSQEVLEYDTTESMAGKMASLSFLQSLETILPFLEQSNNSRIINIYPSVTEYSKLESFLKTSLDHITFHFGKINEVKDLIITGMSYNLRTITPTQLERAIVKINNSRNNKDLLFYLDSDGWLLPEINEELGVY